MSHPRSSPPSSSHALADASATSAARGDARPGGLRLGVEDFADPAAAGASYLFERLLGWGVAVAVRLRATGVRLELGAPPPSDEARELFFVRGRSRSAASAESASSPRASRPPRPERGPTSAPRGAEGRLDRGSSRTEIHKARPAGVAYLSFLLVPEAVEVALVVPARARAEREHLERLLLEKPAIVTEALEALPLPFVVGPESPVPDGPGRVPVQDVTAAQLRDLLHAGETLWIGWTVRADAAVAHATTLGGELEAAMLALGELFRQIAWLARNAPPAPARISRRAVTAEPAMDDLRSTPLTADDRLALLRGARAAARPDARASLRLRSSAGGRTARAGSHAAGNTAGTPVPPARRRSGPPAPPGSAASLAHPDASFDRGAEVEVLAGPFAGRVGVVQEIDGKGDARVLFGLLATRIAAKNLAASVRDPGGGGRPSLGSSHRKGR